MQTWTTRAPAGPWRGLPGRARTTVPSRRRYRGVQVTLSWGEAEAGHWTVGADALAPQDWSGESVDMPAGLLHAVSADGLVAGRAVCLAAVTLLDPRDWRWPEDDMEEWPLCWICLALTS